MDLTSELTIVIPVRIDSQERKHNLESIISFLTYYTSSEIIVMEVDDKQKLSLKILNDRIKYYFRNDSDEIFHHTRYRNELLSLSKKDIVAVWDADIFINSLQIKKGIDRIKNGLFMCIPYDGRAFYLNPAESVEARENIFSYVCNYKEGSLVATLGRLSVGGVFIVNKQRYLKIGGENENFYGWGPEDAERFKRMEILEEPVERIDGPLFHLYHPRGINSTFGRDIRDKNNVNELIKICGMNTIQLKEYIDTWTWKK